MSVILGLVPATANLKAQGRGLRGEGTAPRGAGRRKHKAPSRAFFKIAAGIDTITIPFPFLSLSFPFSARGDNSMATSRRRFLTAGASCLLSAPRGAAAQAYPSRPVRIVVGFGAGGAPDILARLIGNWLSQQLGQQFIVENRPGAASNIAADAVAHAPPDGYTLLLASMGNAVNASLYGNLSYDFLRDLAPVSAISREPLGMEVHPSFPATSVPEFIAYCRANPGRISYGSAGSGTSLHMAAELFRIMTGLDLVHVPYRSSAAALTDLLGGQVQLVFSPLPSSIDHVRSGRLRALATTGAARSHVLPEVPVVGDFVPGYEATAWYGVCAPANTGAAIVDRLNREINAGFADPTLKARLEDLGSIAFMTSPVEFGRYLAEETEKWGKVVKAAKLRPE
jgi:tripartite-type tricarboxylate transporter receptor subunit TctC